MLSVAAEIVLWVSLALVGYAYLAYPVLVWACARCFGRTQAAPAPADGELPGISLVIAAHNEERWIRQRIENALTLDYPGEKLEVIIASDGSTDRTVEIVREFASRGVQLIEFVQN